jgi:hypothetical protein
MKIANAAVEAAPRHKSLPEPTGGPNALSIEGTCRTTPGRKNNAA